MSERSEIDQFEFWKKYVVAFWWLRGAAAAVVIASLVEKITDFSRFEFLRAIHAAIVGWETLARIVGKLIGEIPYIPELSPNVVNALLFVSSVGIPSAFAGFKYITDDYDEKEFIKYVFSIFWGISLSLLLVYISFEAFKNLSLSMEGEGVVGWYRVNKWQCIRCVFGISFGFLFIFMMFLRSFLYLPGFSRGVVHVCVFLITVEVLYLLEVPWVHEQINGFACDVLADGYEGCVSGDRQ